MTIPTPHTIGHMVWAAGATDAHGNPVDQWAAAVDVEVFAVAPRTTGEPGGTQVVEGLSVLAPAGFTADPRDRFVWKNQVYELIGEVSDWGSGPFGFTPGCSFDIKRVDGGR